MPASFNGNVPNKFFDYIAAGLPVVNNYPGWLADLINEHHCGLAVPAGDPGAFADALCWLADHPEEYWAMGRQGRALACQAFDRAKLARRFTSLLEGWVRRGDYSSDRVSFSLMDQNDLLRIINRVRENKHQEPIAGLQPGLRLREDLGFESLDLAELTVRIEEKFKLDVFANGLVHTVGELLAKITASSRR